MKVDYYCSRLNADLVAKALNQGEPPTLVGWIQLACKVENLDQLVKMIHQTQQASQKKPAGEYTEGKEVNTTLGHQP